MLGGRRPLLALADKLTELKVCCERRTDINEIMEPVSIDKYAQNHVRCFWALDTFHINIIRFQTVDKIASEAQFILLLCLQLLNNT